MSPTLLDSVVHIVASDEEEAALKTLQHQDNLLMLLVLVITPYYLRTLYDYTLERFNALLLWISEHGYGIRCGESRRGHIGLGMVEVLQSRIPWREARTMTGMDKDTALVAGFARLLLWHHLQPIAYGLAFVASWNDVSPLQRMLGVVVALREAIYIALTLICLHFNPAYLLVDTAATWRKDRYVALIFTLLYVLSPEKYVWLALVRGAAETGDASAVSAADPPYGRLPPEADEGDVDVAQRSAGAAAIEVSSSERPAALSGPAALAGRAGRDVENRQVELEAEVELELEAKRLRDEQEAEVERIAGTLHAAQSLGPRGAAILLFGGFLVLLDMVALIAMAVALDAAHRAPAPLLVGYSVTAVGGLFVLVCAVGYAIVMQIDKRGVPLPGPLAALYRQVRLVLLLAGVLSAEAAAAAAAPAVAAAAIERPAQEALDAFWEKVGSSEEEVRSSTSLDWQIKGLDAGDARIVAYLLASPVTEVLTNLDLWRNSIGDEGAKALASALRVNGVLKTLNLGNNFIRAEGAAAIAEALRGNGVLTELDLSSTGARHPTWNEIGDEGAAALASALRVNGVLTSLDVGSNGLTEEAALGIVRVRQRNKLTSLGLARCGIGPAGAAEIAEYVSGSGVLTTLTLSDNNIRAEGAAAVAKALRGNKVLTNLNLRWNNIGPTGAAAIADALKVNGVLTKLNLQYNSLGDEGKKAIRDAVSGREGFELQM